MVRSRIKGNRMESKSICNGKYTEENLIQCCIDLCGHIDTRTDELMEVMTNGHKIH